MNIFSRLAGLFAPVKSLPEGVYHLQSPKDDEKSYRMHLRMQKNGRGILILNASTVLHLNPTAAEYAFYLIKGTEPKDVARTISGRYRIKKVDALRDYTEFVEQIDNLVHRPDLDPVSILGFGQAQPNSAELSAPLRLDCALTYRLSPGGDPINAPSKRVDRELSTDEWRAIMDKAWSAGVPHIVFTGGEATLRDDLPLLIAHAESNGQVAGLLTDGKRLVDNAFFESLLQAGMDHLMVILPVGEEPNWTIIRNIIIHDIFLAVHFTVTTHNASSAKSIIAQMRELGVENISISVADPMLQEFAVHLSNYVAELNMRLITDLPVPYSEANPVAFESSENTELSGTGKAWLYIEPDGDVLRSQGLSEHILGNILRDSWEKFYPT